MVTNVKHTAHKQLHERMIQVVSHLIRDLGIVDKTKVMKLVYLADRDALKTIERPVTFDDYHILANGPAAADIEQGLFSRHPDSEWTDAFEFSDPVTMKVKDRDHTNDLLSESEIGILDSVIRRYGQLTRDELISISHATPEWKAAMKSGKKTLTHENIMDGLKLSKAKQERILYAIKVMRGMANTSRATVGHD
jgi:uncharacterized phage-associated protein